MDLEEEQQPKWYQSRSFDRCMNVLILLFSIGIIIGELVMFGVMSHIIFNEMANDSNFYHSKGE